MKQGNVAKELCGAALFAALVYACSYMSYLTTLGAPLVVRYLVLPLAIGVAFGVIRGILRFRVPVVPFALALILGFVASMAYLAAFRGWSEDAFDCWSCHSGDTTNGVYFVLGVFFWAVLSAWSLAFIAAGGFAASLVIGPKLKT